MRKKFAMIIIISLIVILVVIVIILPKGCNNFSLGCDMNQIQMFLNENVLSSTRSELEIFLSQYDDLGCFDLTSEANPTVEDQLNTIQVDTRLQMMCRSPDYRRWPSRGNLLNRLTEYFLSSYAINISFFFDDDRVTEIEVSEIQFSL